MSNLENIQRKISEGVAGWLLFEFHCFRGYLFNEKYLSYPVGQILNSITKYKTLTEINHPCGNSSQGRPLQIDFVLINKKEKWKYAFESKWIGNSTISLGSMIWDLIRLQNIFIHSPKIECYFILAGFEKKINILLEEFDLFFDAGTTKKNKIVDINQTYMTFNLNELDDITKKFINDRIEKYPNFLLYTKIECKPAHKYPKTDTINMTFSTYIFQVFEPDLTTKVRNL
jgi:hypothetical protein